MSTNLKFFNLMFEHIAHHIGIKYLLYENEKRLKLIEIVSLAKLNLVWAPI